ncbi:unnamed protein product [Callosobruchus maculatus]|uniref:Reverse transcriptase domain-containing protein n=1 Tax=Callosobruchus maculatus TaxID=64391 RepID=A0A653BRW8_CALMS|nr:unnamed protein product [Callosobruchus maculatus]
MGNRSFIFGTLYRPPSKNVSEFLINLEDNLIESFLNSNDIICGGDINIDFMDCQNKHVQAFCDCLEMFNLTQIVDSPTRITKTSSSLIDVIVVPKDINVSTKGAVDIGCVSDHLLVYCGLDLKCAVPDVKHSRFRNFKRIDKNLLQDLLLLSPFQDIFYIPSINEKVSYFNSIIINIFDTVAPLREMKHMNFKPPWLTDNVRLLMSLRDKAFSKFKRTRRPSHWDYYKLLKNYTTNALRREQSAYFMHCCYNSHGNSKDLWKRLRKLDIMNNSKTANIPIEYDDPNKINDHFLSPSNIVNPDAEKINFYNNNYCKHFEQLFSFNLVSETIIYKYLTEIKSSAMGADGINIEMLLLCCPYILPFITHIINSCLLENVFPDSWKVAKVFPLPKKNSITSMSDLRPISILPVLSKILEKIIKFQFIRHLDKYTILPPYQSGFRQGFSCTSALLDVTDDIIKEIDDGNTTALVLLDYSKAFDTINHQLMLAILKYIGCTNEVVKLFSDYLSHRYQFVETSIGASDRRPVLCGVPQGSVLGPVLFSVYSAGITSSLRHSKPYLYADDTQIKFSFQHTQVQSAISLINEDLNILAKESISHQLTINPLKSTVLLFGKHKNDIKDIFKISIGNTIIPHANFARNLGLILDSDLRFSKHIDKCISRSYGRLKLLYPYRHIFSTKLKILLCDILVLSLFNYCDVIYGPCLTKNDINRVQKVQKSCLRYVFGVRRYDPVSYKLPEAGWLDMRERRELHAAVLFHKIILYKTPPYLYNKITFRTDIHNINLRFRGLISQPRHCTAMFTRSFSHNIYKLYNQVPTNLKSLPVSIFKVKFKHLLFLNK